MDITFHVGFPKTGTTFLQKEVFPKLEGINYRDIFNTPDRDFKIRLEELIDPRFKFSPDTWKKRFGKFVTSKRPNLISYEDLVGDVFLKDNKLAARIAARIHSMYPGARMIVGLRDAADSVVSLYRQYIHEGGVKDFKTFVRQNIDLSWYEHEAYIARLRELFGEGNVYVYEFAELRKDSSAFVDGICGFLELASPKFESKRHNIGYGKKQVEAARVLNRLFKTSMHPGGIIPWSEKWWFAPYPPRFILQSKLSYWLSYDRQIVSEEEKQMLAEMLAK